MVLRVTPTNFPVYQATQENASANLILQCLTCGHILHWYFLAVWPFGGLCIIPGGVVGIFAALIGCGTMSIEGVDTVGGEDEEAEPLLLA